MEAIWKPVVGYEGLYEISSLGKVRSIYRGRNTGKALAPIKSQNGYLVVTPSKNGVVKQKSIHRLVAMAFLPNPKSKICVNHINGDKHDNRVENLEWATYQENEVHSHVHLGKQTWNKNLTHCKRGHEFTASNTRVEPDGEKSCRECHKLRMKAYRLRIKQGGMK
jgi:hypothetical protein